jgi:hypothetical protein
MLCRKGYERRARDEHVLMTSSPILNTPIVLFVISVLIMWGAAWLGASVRKVDLEGKQREDLGIILGATLTLLGLIIGFSFSMATNRYDLRKTLEEAEANAIGTELVRAELLPSAAAADVNVLLRKYLRERIVFYEALDQTKLMTVDADTAALQGELWAAVRGPATAAPNPVNALVLAGMNDVLNSQGYTQAAWWNRIPKAAWWLMAVIALCANFLVGFNSHRTQRQSLVLLIMPVLAAIAFLLIADLDSPRGGLIRVVPQNLESLASSLAPP